MITAEAITALAERQSIEAAANAVMRAADAGMPVALPSSYTVHDLERMARMRRRQRGSMTTPAAADFAAYVEDQKEDGAQVFVDPAGMRAVAVLNLGTPEAPGHADHTATYAPQMTAAYAALLKLQGTQQTQSALAEWLEDWSACITYRRDDTDLDPARAVSAVRAITIEGLRRVATEAQQMSAQRSALESVRAQATKDGDALPTRTEFACEPYAGLARRTFSLRLSITTGGDKPALTLRIARHEEHVEQMAAELSGIVTDAISGSVPVLVGAYRVGA